VTKAELGTKRLCPNCGARYYDLNRDPIICPRCGTRFEVVAATRSRPVAAKAAVVPEPEEAELEKDAVETVTLEEADEEAAGGGAVKVDGDDEEIEADEDDTFLADDDEEEDDVEDIVGDVDEEER
jgi:uncharacterized protein (TIGR02300 family)